MADMSFFPCGGSGGDGGGGGKAVKSMSINDSGELVVCYNDGTSETLGKVVGADGKVYVPHIDDHKVLSWTIEDAAGEVPDPVDLNPYDEWGNIDESGTVSDYVWESIE